MRRDDAIFAREFEAERIHNGGRQSILSIVICRWPTEEQVRPPREKAIYFIENHDLHQVEDRAEWLSDAVSLYFGLMPVFRARFNVKLEPQELFSFTLECRVEIKSRLWHSARKLEETFKACFRSDVLRHGSIVSLNARPFYN